MKSLKELQRQMKKLILAGESEADFVAGQDRISVYSEGYVARLQDVLRDNFPTASRFLGNDFWSISEIYIRKHPSKSFDINDYGEFWPAFLKRYVRDRFPFLLDLAQLEWLISRSFHALNATPFDPAPFSSRPPESWENATILFQTWLRTLSSDWPVLDIWNNRKEVDDVFFMPRRPKETDMAIFRKGDEVFVAPLDRNERKAIDLLATGKTLGQTLEQIGEIQPDAPVFAWFSKWITFGWIKECTLP